MSKSKAATANRKSLRDLLAPYRELRQSFIVLALEQAGKLDVAERKVRRLTYELEETRKRLLELEIETNEVEKTPAELKARQL